MDREGATDYAVYDIPNGRMAFRLADHNANGNNFEKDDADSNISVYVAIKEYPDPESEFPFTEPYRRAATSQGVIPPVTVEQIRANALPALSKPWSWDKDNEPVGILLFHRIPLCSSLWPYL